MSRLVDTNLAFRRVMRNDPLHGLARAAVDAVLGETPFVFICPQTVMEFHALATRPVTANGLGLTSAAAREQARAMVQAFPVLPDIPAIHPIWCDLVDRYGVLGRQVYDTRLVAVMLAHGLTHLLTLDASHFRRFTEITVVEPADVIGPAEP